MKRSSRFFVFVASIISINFHNTYTHAAAINGQGTWETTLQARDFDANPYTIEGWYDTVLGITWLTDGNYALTTGGPEGYFVSGHGTMSWDTAMIWADTVSINGITGWRLPRITPVDGVDYNRSPSEIGTTDVGFNISAPGTLYAGTTVSEMAHLNYITLGNIGQCEAATSKVGYCSPNPDFDYSVANTGPFENVYQGRYWSESVDTLYTDHAWSFHLARGQQEYTHKVSTDGVWLVHDGDIGVAISSVPIPAAIWLFGSGLLGLLGISRHK